MCLNFIAGTFASAQKVRFHSSAVEECVKRHIGLGQTEDVTAAHVDTITEMNLAGLGLTDIRDVRLFPKVRKLDLSYNLIENVAPLASLDSLRMVYLGHNLLEDLNPLSFSYAKEMYVDIAFNRISDFSLFYNLTPCEFTIVGAELQVNRDQKFFDVDYLVYDATLAKPIVSCRVNTNMDGNTLLKCRGIEVEVPTDRNEFEYELGNYLDQSGPIYLINGTGVDSTYAVPVANYAVAAGRTVTMETGLPDNFKLSCAYASFGQVKVVDNTLQYTAPDQAKADVVKFSYFRGSALKGISMFYINKDSVTPGDVNGDGNLDEKDVVKLNKKVSGLPVADFIDAAADMNKDGKTNIVDIVLLIDKIIKLNAQ